MTKWFALGGLLAFLLIPELLKSADTAEFYPVSVRDNDYRWCSEHGYSVHEFLDRSTAEVIGVACIGYNGNFIFPPKT